MLWLKMGVGKDKQVSFLQCLYVPITVKCVMSGLSLSRLFVNQPQIRDRCIRERSVCAVDRDIYTWVSFAYKWWYHLWLWIRELTGVVYEINSSSPRTESWETPQNKGSSSEKQFLIYMSWTLFVTNERIQVSAVLDMSYQSERPSKRTEQPMVSNTADKYKV